MCVHLEHIASSRSLDCMMIESDYYRQGTIRWPEERGGVQKERWWRPLFITTAAGRRSKGVAAAAGAAARISVGNGLRASALFSVQSARRVVESAAAGNSGICAGHARPSVRRSGPGAAAAVPPTDNKRRLPPRRPRRRGAKRPDSAAVCLRRAARPPIDRRLPPIMLCSRAS